MDARKKYGWIVSLRAFAAMAIVLLHVISGWSVENSWGGVTGLRWLLDGVVIQVLVRWAVPVFVMISGFLLLNPEKEMPLSKIGNYLWRMITVLLVFGYAYCLMEAIVEQGLNGIPDLLRVALKNLVEGKSWAHMWYVYMLIGLYLLTPMLRVFVKHASMQTMRWTLIVLFMLTVVRPTVNRVTNLDMAALIPVTTCYLFYYLMGRYLSFCMSKRKISLSLLLVGGIGVAVMQMTVSDGSVEAASPDNFYTAIYAVALFSLAKDSDMLERAAQNRLISSISKYSFGIYLLHPFFLNLLMKGLHMMPGVFPILIGEMVFFTVALFGAYGTTWALRRIPLIQRILH